MVKTLKRRLVLGGTDYAERLVRELVKHPEIAEVLKTEIVSLGKKGDYAVDIQIVYQASRPLNWDDLMTAAKGVPLYEFSFQDERSAIRVLIPG